MKKGMPTPQEDRRDTNDQTLHVSTDASNNGCVAAAA
jgi:hypothetical protein